MNDTKLHEIRDNFTRELIAAEKGQKTSLAFIRNTIPSSSLVRDEEIFQVMVIGGTNFYKALIKRENGLLEILSKQHDNLPLFPDKTSFFSFIERHLDPQISILAINFGFPTQPIFENGKLEAIFLLTSKESTFLDLMGKNICAEFEEHLRKKYARNIQVSMANDTICLLLSGLSYYKNNFAAGIVGTGINFAIFLDTTKLINLELGMFTNFPHTEFLDTINQTTNSPTEFLFEKEVAGGYLYMHFNAWLKKEKRDFSPLKNTIQLSQLAQERQDELGNQARKLLERSAMLTACVVAGILNFKNSDMTFVMQGSLFWKGYTYKEVVEATVQRLTIYHGNFVQVENAGFSQAVGTYEKICQCISSNKYLQKRRYESIYVVSSLVKKSIVQYVKAERSMHLKAGIDAESVTFAFLSFLTHGFPI